MKELNDILIDALGANEELVALTEGRIYDTCVEVPPYEKDNTPVPYIIVMEDPYNNDMGTKDDVWESDTDRVQSSIEIAASDPSEVRTLRRKVRKAIGQYMQTLDNPPYLVSSSNDGISWDWQDPVYFDRLHYQCDVNIHDYGQEES